MFVNKPCRKERGHDLWGCSEKYALGIKETVKLVTVKYGEELICLSNMENINAMLIEDGLSQKERLIKLNKIAIHQMSILEEQTTKILK